MTLTINTFFSDGTHVRTVFNSGIFFNTYLYKVPGNWYLVTAPRYLVPGKRTRYEHTRYHSSPNPDSLYLQCMWGNDKPGTCTTDSA